MPKVRITVASIEKAKRDIAAGAARVEISDAEARGLVLRAGPTGIVWQFRFEMNGRSSRLTLGAVDEWSIAEARLLVGDARKLIAGRIRRPDETWVQERRVEYGKIEAPTADADPRHSIYWTFRQARDHYLDHVKRTLSADTYRDYRQTLSSRDLSILDKRPVPSITRRELSSIIAQVHASGREPTAEAMARKLKPFWRWLSEDLQIDRSGVEPDVMRGLKSPPRSRRDEDDEDLDETLYVPPMHEIGRILAVARSGALDPIVGLAIELMIFAPQRRRAVAMALINKFEPRSSGNEGLWRVPAHHRKTAIRRGDKSDLVIPLPAPAWTAVVKARSIGDDDRRRLFFRRATPRATATTSDHIDPGTITKSLSYMPGISASPHDLRRGFASHGQKDLGFSLLDVKSILDHSRGFDPGDVTMQHYALHDGTHFTWRIMRAWADHVEAAYREALDFDNRLRNLEWISRELYEARQRAKGRDPKPLSLEKTPPK